MNFWKPLALVSTSTLIFVVGYSGLHEASASSIAGNQPHMEAARTYLKQARASLEKAEHNKGGWRAAAISATDTALRETERGIAFGDK